MSPFYLRCTKILLSPKKYVSLLLAGFILASLSGKIYAQDYPPSHATLRGWTNEIQRVIYNREAHFGGRFYQHGLFRFFTREMDYEYEMDIATINPTPLDTYDFWSSDNALQSSFGSLNYQRFVVKTKFRSIIPLKNSSYVRLQGIQEQNLRTDNFFFYPGYYRKLGTFHTVGMRHTLSRYKADLDASFYYRLGNNSSGFIEAGASILDWPNNIVHTLITNSDRDYEVKQKYTRQPFLFSLQAESPKHPFLRAELSAGIQTESKAQVVRAATPDSSFTNREQVHYLGGLIEYFQPTFTAGLIYQREFTKMSRYPDDPSSQYSLNFGNREIMNRLGSYITKLFWGRLRVEQWTWYEYNRDRLWGSSVPEGWLPFHFRENRLRMKSMLLYRRPDKGFQGGFELNLDHRYVLGEESGGTINLDFRRNYPDQVSGNNQRISLKFGYHNAERINFMVGVSYDLDGDLTSGWGTPSPNRNEPSRFDGGFAQMTFRW